MTDADWKWLFRVWTILLGIPIVLALLLLAYLVATASGCSGECNSLGALLPAGILVTLTPIWAAGVFVGFVVRLIVRVRR